MTEPLKILFITQEMMPYAAETEISRTSLEVPQRISGKDREIRAFMPKYGGVNERRNQLHEVIRLSGMNIIIDDTDHPLTIKVASLASCKMQVYFIANEDYFEQSTNVNDKNGNEFADNDERMIFFTRGVMETVKKLRWAPNIIHCHGWFSALAPLFIKRVYNEDPFFKNSKVVYSIYENDFKKSLCDRFAEKVHSAIDAEDGVFSDILGGEMDFKRLSKLAIDNSDAVAEGSQVVNEDILTYAREKELPILPYVSLTDMNYAERYNEFYNRIAYGY